ncbi:hypothetical protein ACJ41O_013428 [Fusarium nematophilum]
MPWTYTSQPLDREEVLMSGLALEPADHHPGGDEPAAPTCVVCFEVGKPGHRVDCRESCRWCYVFPPRCHAAPIFPTQHFQVADAQAYPAFSGLPIEAIANWELALDRALEHHLSTRPLDLETLQYALDNPASIQFCPGCERLFERAAGGNFMICPCGAEFCFLCAARYADGVPTCGHGILDFNAPSNPVIPRRLLSLTEANLSRALEPLAIEPRPPVIGPGAFPIIVCEHPEEIWRKIRFRRDVPVFDHAARRCERCSQALLRFGFECWGCKTLACAQCKNEMKE